jgi:hypothetical protein
MPSGLHRLPAIALAAALCSCVDHGDPDLHALVVSADEVRICVSVTNSGFEDLNGCYPVDPAATAVKAGDCIAARFPSAGSGLRPDMPLSRLKVLDRGCGT